MRAFAFLFWFFIYFVGLVALTFALRVDVSVRDAERPSSGWNGKEKKRLKRMGCIYIHTYNSLQSDEHTYIPFASVHIPSTLVSLAASFYPTGVISTTIRRI